MRLIPKSHHRLEIWPVAIGAAVGFATGILLSRRIRRQPPLRTILEHHELAQLEKAVVERLLADPRLKERPIEVGALNDGIVELTGTVRDEEEARQAVSLAGGVPGVRTVLNRLDIEAEEAHLSLVRRRHEASGAPAESHWYGLGVVGTGRRRQGRDTDPDRPDDRVELLERSMGTDRVLEDTSEIEEKLPPAVAGHSTVPAAPTDRGTHDQASHRRLGNEPPSWHQDVNPEPPGRDLVKKAEKILLEQAESGGAAEQPGAQGG